MDNVVVLVDNITLSNFEVIQNLSLKLLMSNPFAACACTYMRPRASIACAGSYSFNCSTATTCRS
jgi:hypothetical protein